MWLKKKAYLFLKNQKEIKRKIKSITDEIGLYIPTKIILGGRIDITFEIDKKDKEKILFYQNKIFNPPKNLSKIIKNYSCECLGGIIDFCKNKNIAKWQESLNNDNSKIISYKGLNKIYDYLEDDFEFLYEYEFGVSFPEGIYYGKVKNNQRNGYGKFEYEDGSIYEGEWKNDFINGKGSLRKNGALIYEGEWIDNKRNGDGISYENGKKVYDGGWKDDKKDGRGIYYENDIKVYEGEWKDNKYNGKGKLFSDTNSKRWIIAYFYDGKCIKVEETSSWIPFYSLYKC